MLQWIQKVSLCAFTHNWAFRNCFIIYFTVKESEYYTLRIQIHIKIHSFKKISYPHITSSTLWKRLITTLRHKSTWRKLTYKLFISYYFHYLLCPGSYATILIWAFVSTGTSNWSENYFTQTAGVGLVVNQTGSEVGRGQQTLQSQAEELFLRDWRSQYASTLGVDDVDACPHRPHWRFAVE